MLRIRTNRRDTASMAKVKENYHCNLNQKLIDATIIQTHHHHLQTCKYSIQQQ